MFDVADKNGDRKLNLKEIVHLMAAMNVPTDHEHIRNLFLSADSNGDAKGDGSLNEEEFIRLYTMLTKREEVDELFNMYESNTKKLCRGLMW